MEFTTYEQEFRGATRTIYTTKVGGTTYEAGSLERLKEMVDNHVEEKQGTFKN